MHWIVHHMSGSKNYYLRSTRVISASSKPLRHFSQKRFVSLFQLHRVKLMYVCRVASLSYKRITPSSARKSASWRLSNLSSNETQIIEQWVSRPLLKKHDYPLMRLNILSWKHWGLSFGLPALPPFSHGREHSTISSILKTRFFVCIALTSCEDFVCLMDVLRRNTARG